MAIFDARHRPPYEGLPTSQGGPKANQNSNVSYIFIYCRDNFYILIKLVCFIEVYYHSCSIFVIEIVLIENKSNQ